MGSFAVPGTLPLGRVQVPQRSIAPHSQFPAPRQRSCRPIVVAQAKAGRDPPDTPKDRAEPSVGREWLQTLLSRFGPITQKAQNTAVLDFEKPLVELDNRIKEVTKILLHLFHLCSAVELLPNAVVLSVTVTHVPH